MRLGWHAVRGLMAALVGIGLWPLAPAGAAPPELRILTSYEADVVQPLVQGFARHHPDLRVRVLNKNTHAAVDEILAGNERGFDLFWASAPEAFEVLAGAGRLDARAPPPQGAAPQPWADFAWSAVGWTWRRPFAGPPPAHWNDLLSPAFTGRIGMSHPMRSGTMHSLLETLLQDRGWEAGWAYVLALAGQLKTISARSFGVLDGVERGDFALGLTIDFLALTRAGRGLEFRYGRPIILIPARIAALQGGRAPQAAAAFTAYLLSPEGQALLTGPEIRRIPVDPALHHSAVPPLAPELQAALRFSWSRYDPALAARRYWAVKQLFETFVARDFLLRRELWRRLRALPPAASPAAAQERDRLQRLLTILPISEHQAVSAAQDRATLLAWASRSHGLLALAEAELARLEAPAPVPNPAPIPAAIPERAPGRGTASAPAPARAPIPAPASVPGSALDTVPAPHPAFGPGTDPIPEVAPSTSMTLPPAPNLRAP